MNWTFFQQPQVRRHLLGWALILSLFTYLDRVVEVKNFRVFGLPYSLSVMLGPMLAIYAHYWLLTHELERHHYGRYFAGTVAVIALGGAGLAYVATHTAPNLHATVLVGVASPSAGVARLPLTWLEEFEQGAANVAAVLLLAAIARYLRRGIKRYYQVPKLRGLQLETELNLLKAQVNQHFLFNTLNNLYGLSLDAPDQMPEALLQLADLMRYQLDSSRQSTVTVGTEAEYLGNYIGLEKLRLRANTQVEFTTDLLYPDRPLTPLLLLPLVENCFKHAIGPSGANTICIHLTQTDAGLTLRTRNSIPPHFRPAPSGLGLPTLRARLAQFYPGPRHRLSVEATATHYTATLLLAS
jgi:LytS/YehU family sensor histidine kinase